jgi:hypothetical protein
MIAGCAVSTQRYYLPTNPQFAEVGTVCGFVPWGQTRVPLAESLSTSIQLRPADGRVVLTIQLALSQGTKVRLTEPGFRLQVPSTGVEHGAQLDRFHVSVYGREGHPGNYEYVGAADILEGKGRNADLAGPDTQYAKRDLFVSTATFFATPASAYVLKVPAIEVNGSLLAAQAIPVALVERTGVAACVQ